MTTLKVNALQEYNPYGSGGIEVDQKVGYFEIPAEIPLCTPVRVELFVEELVREAQETSCWVAHDGRGNVLADTNEILDEEYFADTTNYLPSDDCDSCIHV